MFLNIIYKTQGLYINFKKCTFLKNNHRTTSSKNLIFLTLLWTFFAIYIDCVSPTDKKFKCISIFLRHPVYSLWGGKNHSYASFNATLKNFFLLYLQNVFYLSGRYVLQWVFIYLFYIWIGIIKIKRWLIDSWNGFEFV